uniref:Uncharacterized protein n=1 Tax=Neolamprologus brichardi TaxID=32507 RepID=A0A3Q4GNK8_NEOBR
MGAGSSTEAEREPLLVPSYVETNSNPVNSRVYGRRWLVLTLFSLLALMQGMVWNFWGPIQNSAFWFICFIRRSAFALLILMLFLPCAYVNKGTAHAHFTHFLSPYFIFLSLPNIIPVLT